MAAPSHFLLSSAAALAITILASPINAGAFQPADYVGTGSYTDPVTLKEQVAFLVKQDGRELVIGCDRKGSGEVSIFVKARYDETPVTSLLGYNKYRFGRMAKAASAPWQANGEVIRYDDAKFGASKAKAKFLDAMANDTAFHLRFNTIDGHAVSASFNYGSAGFGEIRKMLQQCRPAKVTAELEKMGSALVSGAVAPSSGKTTTPR